MSCVGFSSQHNDGCEVVFTFYFFLILIYFLIFPFYLFIYLLFPFSFFIYLFDNIKLGKCHIAGSSCFARRLTMMLAKPNQDE